MRRLHRPALLIAVGSLAVGLACSQLPLAPGDQPVRPAWDVVVVPAWAALRAALDDPVISVAVGGVIGGLTSLYSSRQSGDQLRQEAARLRRMVNLLSIGLEEAGLIEARRDENNEIVGVTLTLHPQTVVGRSVVHAPTITVSPPAGGDTSERHETRLRADARDVDSETAF